MTITNDEAILQKMLTTMETLRLDQLRLADQVGLKNGGLGNFYLNLYGV